MSFFWDTLEQEVGIQAMSKVQKQYLNPEPSLIGVEQNSGIVQRKTKTFSMNLVLKTGNTDFTTAPSKSFVSLSKGKKCT